jgi:hypothetical protein
MTGFHKVPFSQVAWHPGVHKFVGETLYYITIDDYKFYTDIGKHIHELHEHAGRVFPIYSTYGYQDLWLRFWATQEQRAAVEDYLHKNVRPGEDDRNPIVYNAVHRIWYIWGWPLDGTTEIEDLIENHTLEELDRLQRNSDLELPDGDVRKLILGRLNYTAYARPWIRLFLVIETRRLGVEETNGFVEHLIRAIHFHEGQVRLRSIVEFVSSLRPSFGVELEVGDFWDVLAVAESIRSAAAFMVKKTATYLVQAMHPSEVPTENGFCDFLGRSEAIHGRILSRATGDANTLPVGVRHRLITLLVSWQKYWHFEECKLRSKELLKALSSQKSDELFKAINHLALEFEPVLRGLAKAHAVEAWGSEEEAWDQVVAMYERLRGKSWNDLGEKEAVGVLGKAASKLQNRRLREQSSKLNEWVRIRNIAVHARPEDLPTEEDRLRAMDGIEIVFEVWSEAE